MIASEVFYAGYKATKRIRKINNKWLQATKGCVNGTLSYKGTFPDGMKFFRSCDIDAFSILKFVSFVISVEPA